MEEGSWDFAKNSFFLEQAGPNLASLQTVLRRQGIYLLEQAESTHPCPRQSRTYINPSNLFFQNSETLTIENDHI